MGNNSTKKAKGGGYPKQEGYPQQQQNFQGQPQDFQGQPEFQGQPPQFQGQPPQQQFQDPNQFQGYPGHFEGQYQGDQFQGQEGYDQPTQMLDNVDRGDSACQYQFKEGDETYRCAECEITDDTPGKRVFKSR